MAELEQLFSMFNNLEPGLINDIFRNTEEGPDKMQRCIDTCMAMGGSDDAPQPPQRPVAQGSRPPPQPAATATGGPPPQPQPQQQQQANVPRPIQPPPQPQHSPPPHQRSGQGQGGSPGSGSGYDEILDAVGQQVQQQLHPTTLQQQLRQSGLSQQSRSPMQQQQQQQQPLQQPQQQYQPQPQPSHQPQQQQPQQPPQNYQQQVGYGNQNPMGQQQQQHQHHQQQQPNQQHYPQQQNLPGNQQFSTQPADLVAQKQKIRDSLLSLNNNLDHQQPQQQQQFPPHAPGPGNAGGYEQSHEYRNRPQHLRDWAEDKLGPSGILGQRGEQKGHQNQQQGPGNSHGDIGVGPLPGLPETMGGGMGQAQANGGFTPQSPSNQQPPTATQQPQPRQPGQDRQPTQQGPPQAAAQPQPSQPPPSSSSQVHEARQTEHGSPGRRGRSEDPKVKSNKSDDEGKRRGSHSGSEKKRSHSHKEKKEKKHKEHRGFTGWIKAGIWGSKETEAEAESSEDDEPPPAPKRGPKEEVPSQRGKVVEPNARGRPVAQVAAQAPASTPPTLQPTSPSNTDTSNRPQQPTAGPPPQQRPAPQQQAMSGDQWPQGQGQGESQAQAVDNGEGPAEAGGAVEGSNLSNLADEEEEPAKPKGDASAWMELLKEKEGSTATSQQGPEQKSNPQFDSMFSKFLGDAPAASSPTIAPSQPLPAKELHLQTPDFDNLMNKFYFQSALEDQDSPAKKAPEKTEREKVRRPASPCSAASSEDDIPQASGWGAQPGSPAREGPAGSSYSGGGAFGAPPGQGSAAGGINIDDLLNKFMDD